LGERWHRGEKEQKRNGRTHGGGNPERREERWKRRTEQ
jgi:hypothetical protein